MGFFLACKIYNVLGDAARSNEARRRQLALSKLGQLLPRPYIHSLNAVELPPCRILYHRIIRGNEPRLGGEVCLLISLVPGLGPTKVVYYLSPFYSQVSGS